MNPLVEMLMEELRDGMLTCKVKQAVPVNVSLEELDYAGSC